MVYGVIVVGDDSFMVEVVISRLFKIKNNRMPMAAAIFYGVRTLSLVFFVIDRTYFSCPFRMISCGGSLSFLPLWFRMIEPEIFIFQGIPELP